MEGFDASTEAAHRFWYQFDSRILYRVICILESVEVWTLDDPRAEETLGRFCAVLARKSSISVVGTEDLWIQLLVGIKSAKAFRFMQYLDGQAPGTAARFLTHAEDRIRDEPYHPLRACYDMLLKRNLAFERLQLLGRVFAPERLNLVLRALDQMGD